MEQAYHVLFISVLVFPVIFCLYKVSRSFTSIKKFRSPFDRVQVLNVSVLYALSFNVIFFWQELFLALGKKWLGLKAYLYHNNHGWQGDHELTALLQGSGAMAILLLGLIMFFLDWKLKQGPSWWRQFIFWLGFQGMVMSLTQFQIAMLAKDTDTGQALVYLGVESTTGFFISVSVSLLLILFLRYASARLIFEVEGKNGAARFKTLLRSVAMPALVGIVLIIPFRIFPWHQVVLPVILLIIYLPWVLAFGWMEPQRNVRPLEAPSSKLEFWPLVLLVMLLIFFQGVLSDGLVIE